MDIYFHELQAYKREILNLKAEIEESLQNEIDNFTHFGLGVSNRANYLIVGLCALVECCLYEVAKEEEENSPFKIDDLRGDGLNKGKVLIGKFTNYQCISG